MSNETETQNLPADPPSLVSSAQPDNTSTEQKPTTQETTSPAPEPLTLEALKFPEGLTVDEDMSKSFLEVMNDAALSPADRAQKLVDLQASLATKMAEETQKAWDTMQTEWQNQVRSDPEIGGDKLAPALGEIAKLVDKYGSSELRQVMDLTGAGNHPEVIKFLHKIAKDLGEGGPVLGAPPRATASLADRLYPSMTKKGA